MKMMRLAIVLVSAGSILALAPAASATFDADKMAAPRALCQTHGVLWEGGWRAPGSRGYHCVVFQAENGLVGEFTDSGVVLYVEDDPRAQASRRLCARMGGTWDWFWVSGPSGTGETVIAYGGYSCTIY